MIEIDEKTVDQAVDEILGTGTVHEAETTSTGGAQTEKATSGAEPSRRVYELTCKDCGAKYGSEGPATRYCPACRKKRISAGQKARQKREHAADPQENVTRRAEPEGAGEVENSSETVQEAWDRLDEATAGSSKPAPAPDPADMEMDELLRTAADAMRRDTGDMLLALYETIRDVAKAGGMETGQIVQALYEMDCVLERVARRNEA